MSWWCMRHMSPYYHRLKLRLGNVNHLSSQHQLISSISPIASTTALLLLSISFIITFRLLSIFFLFFFIIYSSFFSWSAFDAFHVFKTFLKLQHNLPTLHDQYLLPFSLPFFFKFFQIFIIIILFILLYLLFTDFFFLLATFK